MVHKPIQIQNLEFSLSDKVFFEKFSTQIPYASRIAIIGRNGSGKSTMLNILRGATQASQGTVLLPPDVQIGYVPQIIEEFEYLSGAQRFQEKLTQALMSDPNLLLLDEPSNHLDRKNRKSVIRFLQNYPHTLILVSHDVELLHNCIDTLWHIDQGKITLFCGNHEDYIRQIQLKRTAIEQDLVRLNRQKEELHHTLMQEQKRAAKSKLKGEKSIENRKWPTIVSKSKAGRANETSGRHKAAISHKKQVLIDKLADLALPEILIPTFDLSSYPLSEQTILSIREGSVAYPERPAVLEQISLSLSSKSRIALKGDNASGKSTLLKAILNKPTVLKTGQWHVPLISHIGYLDQHYNDLKPHLSVFETMAKCRPDWSSVALRRHLNTFLFRKNEEIHTLVQNLSGGEKARLSLAQIAAKSCKLLILDEITNNLDLETVNHVIDVLSVYPGALLVVSHDEYFLEKIKVEEIYYIQDKRLGKGLNL